MEFLVTAAKRTEVEFPCDGGEAVFAIGFKASSKFFFLST
ncbi:hypothetical protein A2U01_0093223, partial [Trifolium medium]|nr:hypothetical protein [Trifolium medium]